MLKFLPQDLLDMLSPTTQNSKSTSLPASQGVSQFGFDSNPGAEDPFAEPISQPLVKTTTIVPSKHKANVSVDFFANVIPSVVIGTGNIGAGPNGIFVIYLVVFHRYVLKLYSYN